MPEDLAIAKAVLTIDIEPAPPAAVRPESRVITLLHAAPSAAERVMTEAYPILKVSLQDRTLILIGDPGELDAASKAIQGLDVESPAVIVAPEVLVYRLKYLNAQRSEEAVKLFPKLAVTVAWKPMRRRQLYLTRYPPYLAAGLWGPAIADRPMARSRREVPFSPSTGTTTGIGGTGGSSAACW